MGSWHEDCLTKGFRRYDCFTCTACLRRLDEQRVLPLDSSSRTNVKNLRPIMTTWHKSYLGTDRAEPPVRLDYSDTYKENDQLDLDLVGHLTELQRAQRRTLCDKNGELEATKAEADRILKLKAAVSSSRQGDSAFDDLSPEGKDAPDATRVHRQQSVSDSGDDVDALTAIVKKVSLSERRIAKEREWYSAKNLFNVIRRKGSVSSVCDSGATSGKSGAEPASTLRQAMSVMAASRQQKKQQHQHSFLQYVVQSPSQPSSRPGSYRMSAELPNRHVTPQLPRAASAPPSVAAFSRRPADSADGRRPRSRRELQRLCSLKIDPFEDVPDYSKQTASDGGVKMEVLENLRKHNLELQSKVSLFIKQLEMFNKKARKSRLDQILEEN